MSVISEQAELGPEPRLEDGTANAAAFPGTKETFDYVTSITSKRN